MKHLSTSFWLLVSVIICILASVALGFWKLFELVGLIPFLICLGIFVILLITTCVCLYFLIVKIKYNINNITKKAKEFIEDLKNKLHSLSTKDIIKIVLKFLKK